MASYDDNLRRTQTGGIGAPAATAAAPAPIPTLTRPAPSWGSRVTAGTALDVSKMTFRPDQSRVSVNTFVTSDGPPNFAGANPTSSRPTGGPSGLTRQPGIGSGTAGITSTPPPIRQANLGNASSTIGAAMGAALDRPRAAALAAAATQSEQGDTERAGIAASAGIEQARITRPRTPLQAFQQADETLGQIDDSGLFRSVRNEAGEAVKPAASKPSQDRGLFAKAQAAFYKSLVGDEMNPMPAEEAAAQARRMAVQSLGTRHTDANGAVAWQFGNEWFPEEE